MKERKEAYDLIELARRLLPEDEGIDLTDREYTFEEMATMRTRLSGMRRAIDIVNKGLARAWHARDPKGYVEMENVKHWLGITKRNSWMDEGSPLGFAEWLKKQDAELIASILPSSPTYPMRMSPIPAPVRDTFFKKLSGESEASIMSKPV